MDADLKEVFGRGRHRCYGSVYSCGICFGRMVGEIYMEDRRQRQHPKARPSRAARPKRPVPDTLREMVENQGR